MRIAKIAITICLYLISFGYNAAQAQPNTSSNSDLSNSTPTTPSTLNNSSLSENQRTSQTFALLNESATLRESGKLEESSKLLEQASLLDPNRNSAATHANLGITLQKLGELYGAYKEFLKALDFEPNMPSALYGLASCYLQLGDIDQAIAHLQDFLNKYPDNTSSEAARRMLLSAQTTPRLKDNPNDSDYYINIVTTKVARWSADKRPIKVFIDSNKKIEGYQPTFEDALISAFNQWAAASNNLLSWEQTSKKKKADIVCRWTNDRNKLQGAGGAELGETMLKYSFNPQNPNQGIIQSVEMTLCTKTLDGKTAVTDEQMLSLCLHEVGHALGIKSHSSNNNDVMFFAIKSHTNTQLSARDRATILRLYSY